MGHPKRSRKTFKRPKKPYDKERLTREKKILKEFGLRRKREIWKAESLLRNFRRRARELLANPDEKKQKELFERLKKMGFAAEKLDDVLLLKLENILSRRLQTVVYKKGLAKSLKESRQMIVHRHVLIDDRKVWYPNYIVAADEEAKIGLDEKMRNQRISEENAKSE